MFIDNKGKLFGKISIIDIIVLVLVVAVVGGVGYKFTKSRSVVTGGTDKVILEFYSEESPDFALKAVRKGDIVGDYDKGSIFGKVVSVSVNKADSWGQDAQGQLVKTSKPGYASAIIKVEGQVLKNRDGGISVNNADYFIGKTITTKAGDSVFVSRLYSIAKE